MHATDRKVGAELIEHQPTHRKKRIARRRNVQRGQIGRLENERGGFMCRGAGPQRRAQNYDFVAVIASRTRPTIGDGEKTIAPRRKHAEARNAIDKRAGVAMEIQDQRQPVLRQKKPGDERFSIRGCKTQFLAVAHPGLRQMGKATIRKILKPALKSAQGDDDQNIG
jgi:hypothetical protein